MQYWPPKVTYKQILFVNYIHSSFSLSKLLPSDRQLVHPEYKLHRCVMINDYSKFLLHVVEFQTTIRLKKKLTFFNDLLFCCKFLRHFVKVFIARL